MLASSLSPSLMPLQPLSPSLSPSPLRIGYIRSLLYSRSNWSCLIVNGSWSSYLAVSPTDRLWLDLMSCKGVQPQRQSIGGCVQYLLDEEGWLEGNIGGEVDGVFNWRPPLSILFCWRVEPQLAMGGIGDNVLARRFSKPEADSDVPVTWDEWVAFFWRLSSSGTLYRGHVTSTYHWQYSMILR